MVYTLMHKNIPVADVVLDEATGGISKIAESYHVAHLPLGAAEPGCSIDARALNAWWMGRAIPASRSGLRDALPLLGVPFPAALLEKCLGLSLSDQYWIRPKGTPVRWDTVNFFVNDFSEDVGNALFGGIAGNAAPDLMSPDNTSDGWLKKKWIISDGKRLLVKGGSAPFYQEPLNELLGTAILRRLGTVPYVPYELRWDEDRPLSVCADFITPQTELISAWYVMRTQEKENHISLYQHFLNCCSRLGVPDARERLDQMLTLDYLIANTDRHQNNFGIVRDAESLLPTGAAPIFDCGTSMWHDIGTHRIQLSEDVSSRPFKKKHSEQIKLVSSLAWLDIGSLQGIAEEYAEILRQSTYIDDSRRDCLCRGIQTRINLLSELQAGMRPVQGIGMNQSM